MFKAYQTPKHSTVVCNTHRASPGAKLYLCDNLDVNSRDKVFMLQSNLTGILAYRFMQANAAFSASYQMLSHANPSLSPRFDRGSDGACVTCFCPFT